jgi:hypothetical protein
MVLERKKESNVVITRANKGPRKVRKALERLKFHTKLTKRCHNQANIGPRKVGKALERLDLPSKFV